MPQPDITTIPFGTAPGDAVALLSVDGVETDYGAYERVPAGQWTERADGALVNAEHLSFPVCASDSRQHWIGGIALMRGETRYRTLALNGQAGMFEGINFWFRPGQLQIPRES